MGNMIKQTLIALWTVMRTLIKTIWTGLRSLLKKFWNSAKDDVTDTMSIAFPQKEKKLVVAVLLIAFGLFLAWLIACFDIGFWISDCSVWGMIQEYVYQERGFPLLTFLLVYGILLAVIYYYIRSHVKGNTGRGFSLSRSNVYGDARDISKEELRQVAEVDTKERVTGKILGQLDLSEKNVIATKHNPNSNNNMCVFGSPGSGKTFSYVINYILQSIRKGESVICTDSKGELWAETAEYARLHGYTVKRIDFKNPTYSCGWDVLSELRHDDVRSLVASEIIMKNTANEKDIHIQAEQSLLRAVLLYTERNDAISEKHKTLYQAFSMLFEKIADLDKVFALAKHDEQLKIAYDAFASFQGSDNLRGNTISNLANRLQVLTSPPVRQMTSTPDISTILPGQERCIYYCIMSDQHETMKFLSSLFFSFSFLDLVDYADAQPNRCLPVRVNFLMEEAANIGQIPNLSKYLNTCRSRGVDIALTFQSLGQIRDLYGENYTDSILSACSIHACYGFNDRATADHFEWRAGLATVNVKTEQHRFGEGPIDFGRQYSTGDGRRNYWSSNDLMKMPARHVFVVFQRENCLMAHTFGKNKHPATENGQMRTISTEVKIPLSDTAARWYVNRKEAERIAAYNQWVEAGGNPWDPRSAKTMPQIIPYDELEEQALAYGADKAIPPNEKLIRDLQKEDDAPVYELDEDLDWEDMEIEEDEPEKTAENSSETAESEHQEKSEEESSEPAEQPGQVQETSSSDKKGQEPDANQAVPVTSTEPAPPATEKTEDISAGEAAAETHVEAPTAGTDTVSQGETQTVQTTDAPAPVKKKSRKRKKKSAKPSSADNQDVGDEGSIVATEYGLPGTGEDDGMWDFDDAPDIFQKVKILPVSKDPAQAKGNDLYSKLSMDIGMLDVSVRCYNCLKQAKIDTIADLVCMTRKEVLNIRQLGKGTFDELEEKLKLMGLSLADEKSGDKDEQAD